VNLYAYVNSNPVNRADSMGLFSESDRPLSRSELCKMGIGADCGNQDVNNSEYVKCVDKCNRVFPPDHFLTRPMNERCIMMCILTCSHEDPECQIDFFQYIVDNYGNLQNAAEVGRRILDESEDWEWEFSIRDWIIGKGKDEVLGVMSAVNDMSEEDTECGMWYRELIGSYVRAAIENDTAKQEGRYPIVDHICDRISHGHWRECMLDIAVNAPAAALDGDIAVYYLQEGCRSATFGCSGAGLY